MHAISNCLVIVTIILGMMTYGTYGSIEDPRRDTVIANLPYGRGLDSELQLARILLIPQRICHTKRNSELINSLLGLPKNMNNAGK